MFYLINYCIIQDLYNVLGYVYVHIHVYFLFQSRFYYKHISMYMYTITIVLKSKYSICKLISVQFAYL